jgi:hypothetical protein
VSNRVAGPLALAAALLVGAGPLGMAAAQTPGAYLARFAEVRALVGDPGLVASVAGLTLTREAGRFTLQDGTMYLLAPIGGRLVGAVFRGRGTFAFAPAAQMERERLARFEKADTLLTPFKELVLFFNDSTPAELRSHLTFGPGVVPEDVRNRVKSALKYLSDEDGKQFDPDLMASFLNGAEENPGLFYAHIERDGGPLMFSVFPERNEKVVLARPRGRGPDRLTEVVTQFAGAGDTARATTYERRPVVTLPEYRMEVWLDHSSTGDVKFSAAARIRIAATDAVGPWIALNLFQTAEVDSARWDDGQPAEVFKGKESPYVWVHLGRRLPAGGGRTLSLYYRGDLIDRYGDWFFIKYFDWYPMPLDGRSLATFDLTYHTPESFVLASIGDRTDSTLADHRVTTRWVTPRPIQFAAFNVGRFKQHAIAESGAPPITVLYSEDAHKAFSRELLRRGITDFAPQRNMKDAVGGDVLNSMKFFRQVFGDPPFSHFYATEVPYFHGLAFPGLVHLSWTTFQQTQVDGFDEFFRAHEVAHQWWGLGVDYTTYHEQWLSEGFASFAGLWYLQVARKDNKKYFGMLDRWRADIMNRKDEPAPVWLGRRNTSGMDERGYSIIVYQKGAWVLHMLRIMMLDLKTMSDDRFIETMRDFYRTYEGKRATTEDFRRVVEKHIGTDMGWFFQEWVYGSRLPSYRVAWRSTPSDGGQFRVQLQVWQDDVPDGFQMYVPVTVDMGKDYTARVRVKVTGPHSLIELPLMPAQPKSVKFSDLEGVLANVKEVSWSD